MKIIMLFQLFLLMNFSILFSTNNQEIVPTNANKPERITPTKSQYNNPLPNDVTGKAYLYETENTNGYERFVGVDNTQNIQGLYQFRFNTASLNEKGLAPEEVTEIAELFEVLDKQNKKSFELKLDKILGWGCQTAFVINKVLANKNIMEYEKMKEILETQKKEFNESVSAEHPTVKLLLEEKENRHKELLNKKEKEHEDSFTPNNPKIKTIIENNRSVFEKHRSKIFFGLITTTIFATHFYVSPKILTPTFSMFERAFRAMRGSGSVPA